VDVNPLDDDGEDASQADAAYESSGGQSAEEAVHRKLAKLENALQKVHVVSSVSSAGVQRLWKSLLRHAERHSVETAGGIKVHQAAIA